MIRAVVLEDIEPIRKKNIELINKYCPFISVVGETGSVQDGIKIIQEQKPNLVFLDVELLDGSGFEVLESLSPVNFQVIFVSAFNEYAIQSFKFSAIDYLLKPLEPNDLIEAVRRSEKAMLDKTLEFKLNTLLSNFKNPNYQKIVLKTQDKIYSVNIHEIVYCDSYKNYTSFYLCDDRKIIVSNTLKEYEMILKPHSFFRTHQSYLINMEHFDHYIKSDGGNTIVMKNKTNIPLSIRKKDSFLKMLENQLAFNEY